jgi:hypothetical protein
MTETEQRQQAVRNLDPNAFHREFAYEDIFILRQALYEEAEILGIAGIIMTDADLLIYGVQREAIRNQPAEPANNATAAQHKTYDVSQKLYSKQSEGIRTLKTKFKEALDSTTRKAIEEPVHGLLRRTLLQMMTDIMAEYSTMTNVELMNLKTTLQTMRWDATTDLITFMSQFQSRVAFLTSHGWPLSQGEQVMYLQASVEHVVGFASIASAAFYHSSPNLAQQTLVRMVTSFTQTYRTQYVNTTAAQHHLVANQALQLPKDDAIEHIMASAREAIQNKPISPVQLTKILTAVEKGIKQVLQPRQTTNNNARPPVNNNERYETADGTCNYSFHASLKKKHTWDECHSNPANPKNHIKK